MASDRRGRLSKRGFVLDKRDVVGSVLSDSVFTVCFFIDLMPLSALKRFSVPAAFLLKLTNK